ncbi:MAG: DnaD domain protein [Oscillospiraceae bacterium]|nr:DnaD domain protein [Oscillospiraceae bacterium]
MGFKVESELWGSVFAVPGKLVDEHLRLCGGAALKVLLVLLKSNGQAAPAQIAAQLELPVADVLDSIGYWTAVGVLVQTGQEETIPAAHPGKVIPFTPPEPRPAQSVPPEEKPVAAAQKPGGHRKKLSTRQINEMGREDENIPFLLQESQMIMGKPLTPVATDTIAALYSYYGMQPEVILMLLQYCVSQQKDNMRYLEKVAAGWMEAGIDTHEKAEGEILRLTERGKLENAVRRLFGISDRALIQTERDYIAGWKDLGTPVELIDLAYQRTIELKGKLSFAYINGILQNWQAKGIKGAAQAAAEMRGGKNPSGTNTSGAGMDEMEQIFKYGDI